MLKIYRIIKLFFLYRKQLLKNRKYLADKYGFEMNLFLEFYTTIILVDMPKELKDKFGSTAVDMEIKKFVKLVMDDLDKLELNELVKPYEIKKIDNDNYGIAFGYSFVNNKKIILLLILSAITILGLLGLTTFLLI